MWRSSTRSILRSDHGGSVVGSCRLIWKISEVRQSFPVVKETSLDSSLGWTSGLFVGSSGQQAYYSPFGGLAYGLEELPFTSRFSRCQSSISVIWPYPTVPCRSK
ncbi:hypothetical protein DY000_02007264 [Brassica cretica]|uniref:Uncharacterized protein n=1 Tax=Brassica cretica TaxID=69181 RepID=A0ABQ7BUX3_BRACR|nr:hypothetical protein DY000_02007264 [Brassica cretica]